MILIWVQKCILCYFKCIYLISQVPGLSWSWSKIFVWKNSFHFYIHIDIFFLFFFTIKKPFLVVIFKRHIPSNQMASPPGSGSCCALMRTLSTCKCHPTHITSSSSLMRDGSPFCIRKAHLLWDCYRWSPPLIQYTDVFIYICDIWANDAAGEMWGGGTWPFLTSPLIN